MDDLINNNMGSLDVKNEKLIASYQSFNGDIVP